MTHPLRSSPITGPSSLLRGSPPLSDASVLSASRLEPLVPFPLASPARFSRSAPERIASPSHMLISADQHELVLIDLGRSIAPGGLGLRPLDPLAVAIAAGATFIARGFSGRPHELADLIVEGIRW